MDKKATQCETCAYYDYDDETDSYGCMINLDEDDVYMFYFELAKYLPDCTTEDIIVDSLKRYMTIISADVVQKALNETF